MSTSDVDIMVIGETTISEVVKRLKPVEKIINREIHPTVYYINEFKKGWLLYNSNFLMEVMEGEKVFIIGNENKLAEISNRQKIMKAFKIYPNDLPDEFKEWGGLSSKEEEEEE